MGPLLWTALGIAVIAALIYALLCVLLVFKFLHRQPLTYRFPDSYVGTPNEKYIPRIGRDLDWYPAAAKEDVFTESVDGLKLHAVLVPADGPARGTIILCHGFHSSAQWDFSCALKSLHDKGFQLLVIDQRAHGESEGRFLTMGVMERMDIRNWAVWMLVHFGETHPVILEGMSMGAASVLMAANVGLPVNVKGLISDCGFTCPREIFLSVMRSIHIPRFFLWGAAIACRCIAGFDIDGADTRKALAESDLPLLMVHGESDSFVPCYMSQQGFAAAKSADKRLITVPGAEHGMSFVVDEPTVSAALDDFYDRVCPKILP